MLVRYAEPEENGLVDREALRFFTKRSQSVITTRCRPVACDVRSRALLYRQTDVDELEKLPRRRRDKVAA